MHMHAESYRRHNKDEGHRSLEKYTSIYLEEFQRVTQRFYCERELETEQNCNILTPHSYGHNCVSFPFSLAAQPGAWGPTLLGAGFHYRILTPTDWTSCAPSYIIVRHQSSCGCHKKKLIQPVHGQVYILIFLDRMHLLFTQVHFLFWQPDRVRGQFTALCWIE